MTSIVFVAKMPMSFYQMDFRFGPNMIGRITCEKVCLHLSARVLCRCQAGLYILWAGFRRSQTVLWRRRWVKIDKQSIPSVHVGRGSSSLHGDDDKSYTNTSSSPSSHFLGRPRCQRRSLCDGGDFLWKFRRNSKAKSNMGVFHMRCLGKSGKAAKANSCASDTRHALLYAPRHACVRMYRANWMCQRVLRHFARRRSGITLPW